MWDAPDMAVRKWAARMALCLVGIGGALAGASIVPKIAGACDCAEVRFELSLRSETASDATKSDEALWAPEALLTNYDTFVRVEFQRPDVSWQGAVVGQR
jgi:hypothetical protein